MAIPARAPCDRLPAPVPSTPMLLAHLTGHELGLVAALFLAAAILVNLGLRWLERGRR